MDNYFITAERMSQSSLILHRASQHYNACYLSGYVVECYAKILLSKIGISKKIHDLSELRTVLNYTLSGASSITTTGMGRYLIDILAACPNMVSGPMKWDPMFRYDDLYPWDQNMSTLFQQEADKCLEKIYEMKIDGTI